MYLQVNSQKLAIVVAGFSSHHSAHQRCPNLTQVATSLSSQHSLFQVTPSLAHVTNKCRLFCTFFHSTSPAQVTPRPLSSGSTLNIPYGQLHTIPELQQTSFITYTPEGSCLPLKGLWSLESAPTQHFILCSHGQLSQPVHLRVNPIHWCFSSN